MVFDEAALVSRAAADPDGPAFAELVKHHQSALRYSLRQLTGWDEALADDIAQETFVRAYRSITSYRGDAQFSSWLYRIAHNCLVSYYRKRRELLGGDEDARDGADQSSAETAFGGTPSRDSNEELHRDLARAMLQLSLDQRMALHLTLVREYTQGEVAEIMNCPLGTVKSHILRGREKLQQLLSAWQPDLATGE